MFLKIKITIVYNKLLLFSIFKCKKQKVYVKRHRKINLKNIFENRLKKNNYFSINLFIFYFLCFIQQKSIYELKVFNLFFIFLNMF